MWLRAESASASIGHQHGNKIQINSENIIRCDYKSKGHFNSFSWFQHLNAGRQGERHSSVTFRSVVSKFGLILSYTHFDSVGDFLHTNLKRPISMSLLQFLFWSNIYRNRIRCGVKIQIKRGDTVLWFLRKKSQRLLVTSEPNHILIGASIELAKRWETSTVVVTKIPCKINKLTCLIEIAGLFCLHIDI